MITVKILKEMLDQFDDDLPVTNFNEDDLIGIDESEYVNENGTESCLKFEFDNEEG